MTAEHGSFINGSGENSEGAKIFYPGPDQRGFGILANIDDQDQLVFTVPAELPSPQDVVINFELDLDVDPVERKLPTVTRTVRISDINVLVQARDEYEGISVLAEAIKSAGVLLHTPFLAELDEDGTRRYLDFVYGIYGDKVPERKSFEDLTPSKNSDGKDVILLAISGHRRLRALRQLDEEFVDAKIAAGIDPLHALYLQAQENTPKLLKDYERAEQHGRLFAVTQVKDKDITARQFATIVGQKPDVIAKDLFYYILPDEVKNYVVPRQKYVNTQGETVIPDQPLMSFNVACQLGRLVKEGVPKHDVLFLARRFFEENITNEKEARRRVNQYLEEFRMDTESGGTVNIVDLFGHRQEKLQRLRRKRNVASRFEKPADEAISYFKRVLMARNMGLTGWEAEDDLSITGAASRLTSLAEIASELLPLMQNVLDPEKLNEMRKVFDELKRDSELLSSVLDIDTTVGEESA